MLNIILPSLPYQRTVDPMWQEEMDVAKQQGYSVCLYDAEQEKLHQQPDVRYATLYRGWMLTTAEYEVLVSKTPLLVSPEMYLASHRADGWYEAIAAFTPRSIFSVTTAAEAAVESFLSSSGKCFVKGLSKSFGAKSVVCSVDELKELLIRQAVEPQELLFVREFIALSDQPEQRFFVVCGNAFGANGSSFPSELVPVLSTLQSRWFYTIDVAYDMQGKPTIIEIGDGQVSDTKEWQVSRLYETAIKYLAEIKSAA